MSFTPLFELTPAESMFAPFNDPAISEQLPFKVTAHEAMGVRHVHNWDSLRIHWENCTAGKVAAEISIPLLELQPRFDQLIFCMVLPEEVRVQFSIGQGGRWTDLGAPVVGAGGRIEITRDISVRPFDAVRAIFTAVHAGHVNLGIQWWGVAQSDLVKSLIAARPRFDGRWEGLILPVEQWPDVKFASGLLFSESDLDALRAKRQQPYWDEHCVILEERARKCLSRRPEDDLDSFLPQTDLRYIRARELGRTTYFSEPITAGFVGLLNNDRLMGFHALRYLMCLIHTTWWTQSAEARTRGSLWDKRCFDEEMAITAAVMLLDWYDFALTPRARALAQQALWDKGVSVIERDMMKYEYVYTMNQGPWFCRARILAGLYLEKVWPRMRGHTDVAMSDMKEGMEHYVLPDGGTDEGLGYFAVTLHAVLLGAVAYGRARGLPVRTLLPEAMNKTSHFVATLSATQPGRVLMDGDNTIDVVVGDSIAILATIYPEGDYAKIAGACITKRRSQNYFDQYVTEGVFGFILGDARLPVPQTIVPTFGTLPYTGHLTSLRRTANGHSVRLHLAGAKAKASHTHFDKGSFTLELDQHPVLIDRGQVRYDDNRSYTLKRTELHNLLTPVYPGEIFPNQASPDEAVIPTGRGDETSMRARVELGHVWRGVMKRAFREVISDDPLHFTVIDDAELLTPGVVSFHLQTRVPWEIQGNKAVLRVDQWTLTMDAPWAETLTQKTDTIDFQFKPVWHFEARAKVAGPFRLETFFTCEIAG